MMSHLSHDIRVFKDEDEKIQYEKIKKILDYAKKKDNQMEELKS